MKNSAGLFRFNVNVRPGKTKTVMKAIGIYLAVAVVCNIITTFLGWIPYIGWLIQIAGVLVGIYCIIAIILAVRLYLRYPAL